MSLQSVGPSVRLILTSATSPLCVCSVGGWGGVVTGFCFRQNFLVVCLGFCLFSVELGLEPRASHMLLKHSATELYLQACFFYLFV